MKREVIIPVFIVILCGFIFAGSPKKAAENQEYKDIPVTVVEPSFPDYSNLEDVVDAADRIFYGVVTKRKPAFYLSGANATTGTAIKLLYTPINFNVEQMIKGSFKKIEDAYYYEMGGSNSTATLEVRGLTPLQKDDRAVVFSRNSGTGWGNYSVYPVVNGKVTIENANLPKSVAKALENAESGAAKTTMPIEEFIDLIKACIK